MEDGVLQFYATHEEVAAAVVLGLSFFVVVYEDAHLDVNLL